MKNFYKEKICKCSPWFLLVSAALIGLILGMIFTTIFSVNTLNKEHKEIVRIASDTCNKYLIKEGSSLDELKETMKNYKGDFKIYSENEILNKIPDNYKDVFYDVVKYSDVCETALELSDGTITSFYYKILNLGE